MGSEKDAEDIVSEVFIKAFDHIGTAQFDNEQMLHAWIKRIAINECLMKLRRKTKFQLVGEQEAEQEVYSTDILSNIEASELLSLIQSLPAGYRTVFNLYAIEGFTHKEIAEQLGGNIGTSKSQLNKARTHLQAKLKKRKEDGQQTIRSTDQRNIGAR